MNRKSNKLKATLVATAVLTANLCSCASKETKEFKNLVESGEYEDAAEYYDDNKEEIDDESMSETVKISIDAIYAKYLDKTMSARSAVESLKALASTVSAQEAYALEKAAEVEALEASREAFSQGEDYFDQGQYQYAIEALYQVIEADPDYADAQSMIADAQTELENKVLEDAQVYIDSGSYANAISILKDGRDYFPVPRAAIESKLAECENSYLTELKEIAKANADEGRYLDAAEYLGRFVDVFSDPTEIETLIAEYNEAHINQQLDIALEEANNYISAGNYYDAIVSIRAVKELYPDSERLIEFETETVNAYVELQVEMINEYFDAEKYSQALSLCKSAMELLPDNAEFKTLYEKIEPLAPVLLNELTISESAYFENLTSHGTIYEDVVGNKYNPGNLYSIKFEDGGWGDDSIGYAKLYLNGQYTMLEGIAATGNESDTGDTTLMIYGDDTLLYSFNFNRTCAPQEISVDVSGVQWLEITVSYVSSNNTSILLSDFGLAKRGEETEAAEGAETAEGEETAAEETTEAAETEAPAEVPESDTAAV